MTEPTKFPTELVIAMDDGCSPGHPLTPGSCLTVRSGLDLLTGERTRSARYRLVEPVQEILESCAACGLPFLGQEVRSLMGDGSVVHDETQPESMRRCRKGLLARLNR